ncbi:helix-turn-helix transcriptional regulator [Variovorax boronicumulans]|uniref:helix-turn-helix transcriptional regulator n=1 Tax=Variovorax boronicumulans TaxID=436515 RepID=UPI0015870845|nr:AlpA family phage regulatory protein [Variovorax boronicumulans]
MEGQALGDQFPPGSGKADSLSTHGVSFAHAQEQKPQMFLLPIKQLSKKISRSRASIYEMINPKSRYFQPLMPQPIRIGRRIFWVSHEVDAFIEATMAARRLSVNH